MRVYKINLAVEVFTDGPIDGEAFMTALRNHYLDARCEGREPLATETVYYWLDEMVKGSVRAAAHDPVWNGPMLPEEEDYVNWTKGVNPKLVRACKAADAAEKAIAPRMKGLEVVSVEDQGEL